MCFRPARTPSVSASHPPAGGNPTTDSRNVASRSSRLIFTALPQLVGAPMQKAYRTPHAKRALPSQTPHHIAPHGTTPHHTAQHNTIKPCHNTTQPCQSVPQTPQPVTGHDATKEDSARISTIIRLSSLGLGRRDYVGDPEIGAGKDKRSVFQNPSRANVRFIGLRATHPRRACESAGHRAGRRLGGQAKRRARRSVADKGPTRAAIQDCLAGSKDYDVVELTQPWKSIKTRASASSEQRMVSRRAGKEERNK